MDPPTTFQHEAASADKREGPCRGWFCELINAVSAER